MTAPRTSRTIALACAGLLAASFFLPVLEPLFGQPATRGWEAFWMSLEGWTEIGSWDASALPIVFAWLGNVAAVLGFVAAWRSHPPSRTLVWLLPPLAITSLGPLLSAPRELAAGYFVWSGAVLALAGLGLVRSMGRSA
jgi:hypothetical protein